MHNKKISSSETIIHTQQCWLKVDNL